MWVKDKISYLLDDLWGHSHLLTDLHGLSTSTLRDRRKKQRLLGGSTAKDCDEHLIGPNNKSQSLTAAAG